MSIHIVKCTDPLDKIDSFLVLACFRWSIGDEVDHMNEVNANLSPKKR